jgi:hypothetical protein
MPLIVSSLLGPLRLGHHRHLRVERHRSGNAPVTPGFVVIVMLKLTFSWLADENSPYTFTDAECRNGTEQCAAPPPHGA